MAKRYATLLICLAASSALAHDTWLIPSSMAVAPGNAVTLDITSGMAFPAPEAAVKPDRLAAAHCRLAGKVVDISDRTLAKKSLRLRVRAESAGVATVWAESKPRTLDLKPAEVKEYLEEIGATETVGKDWEAGPEPRKWRETYTKHAKTFLRVGNPESDGSWAKPTGMALEMVPEKDPTSLAAGDELPVRVLLDGQPLPGISVGLLAAGEKSGQMGRTDATGRVSFRIGRPGWWLLRATHIVRSATSREEWVSHFATLTVTAGKR